MDFLAFVFFIATGFFWKANAQHLRKAVSEVDSIYEEDYVPIFREKFAKDVSYFAPMRCNENIGTCVNWSSVFGTQTEYTNRIIVDCGTCVTVDIPTVTLRDGIDIRGRLVFNDGFAVNMNTASMIVQGALDMTAMQPVNGTPLIRITMIGEDDDQVFQPIDENAFACGASPGCKIGRKSITVAGGQVNLHGLPSQAPTWVPLQDVAGGTANRPTSILVDASVLNAWEIGAQIVVTAHTVQWDDHQERTITGVALQDGFARLDLDAPIRKPTTTKEFPDFAVEVALLSRNILFEGGSSTDDGGHLWILQTPGVVQTIEGIEFQLFGQQGVMGRYPIHFHHCKDVSGSVVSKNSIHQSHQRCVVLHGTDNLLVQENVAYDTAGHCYILEDGIETGNTFDRNLGAQTAAAGTLIPASSGNGSEETDDQPSTFWITNPSNFYTGNVAAGSEDSGFWFELFKRGDRANEFSFEPILLPLGSFSSNTAHSNTGKTGAIRLYPEGFLPAENEDFVFSELKVYRNAGRGIFIHLVHGLQLVDSLFADNTVGVDIDRAEGISVHDTIIIGQSSSYEALMQLEGDTQSPCENNLAVGLDLHSWSVRNVNEGVTIRNVEITGYSHIACRDHFPIRLDPHTSKQGLFEVLTSFTDMILDQDGADMIDFCDAYNGGVDSIYLIDQDGSLRPTSSSANGLSALVSSGPKMLSFVDSSKCTNVEESCYSYCETCFLSVRYEVNPRGTEELTLKVCSDANPRNCIFMPGSLRINGNKPYADHPRTFMAHLPPGSYEAVFVDPSGAEVWPSFVREINEEALCPGALDINLREPISAASTCSELARNGNAELSSTDPMFWLGDRLSVAPGAGVNGSNAIQGVVGSTTPLIQYVDTRCLVRGSRFSVEAMFKLVTQSGNLAVCDPTTDRCPTLGISVDGVSRTLNSVIGENQSGYQSISASFDVDSDIASSDAVQVYVLFVERTSNTNKRELFVDDFKVSNDSPGVVETPAPVFIPPPPTNAPQKASAIATSAPVLISPPPTNAPQRAPIVPPVAEAPQGVTTEGSMPAAESPAPTIAPVTVPVAEAPQSVVVEGLTPAPSKASSTSDKPVQEGGNEGSSGSMCFSAAATVYVENQVRPVAMENLQIGDRVLTGNRKYEQVYAFGHRHTEHTGMFLQITSNSSSVSLELSREHMLYLKGKEGPVRADSVKVGDTLVSMSSNMKASSSVITRIRSIERDGLFAPLTSSGTIVVDGIVASTYVAVQSRANEYVEVYHDHTIPLLQADVIHMWLSPLRLACMGVSPSFCRGHHDENGLNNFVAFGMNFILWGEKQCFVLQAILLVMTLWTTGFFMAIELAFGASHGPLVMLVVVVTAWNARKTIAASKRTKISFSKLKSM